MNDAHEQEVWVPQPGEAVALRINRLKAIVLKELEEDESIGPKFLVRDSNHQLKQVFLCEVDKWEVPQVIY